MAIHAPAILLPLHGMNTLLPLHGDTRTDAPAILVCSFHVVQARQATLVRGKHSASYSYNLVRYVTADC